MVPLLFRMTSAAAVVAAPGLYTLTDAPVSVYTLTDAALAVYTLTDEPGG